jgi:hypothetical protein
MLQSSSSEAAEAVKALASAIRLDRNLEYLYLQLEGGFTDEAGVALAEVLTINKTLRRLTVSIDSFHGYQVRNVATLGVPAYKAFSAMLSVNTSLFLELPPFETDGVNDRLLESRKQMVIEQRLNQVGRGSLLSSSHQTTRGDYVDALHVLSSCSVDDSPAFQVSCLYSLLRLHPAVCMS